MPLRRRSGLDRHRRIGAVFRGGRGERRARVGRLPAGFFAEAGEFLFVEAFVVFLEDLFDPREILLLDEYVASWLSNKPPKPSLEPFRGRGRKTRRSSLGRNTFCSASALPTPSTAITASAAQVFVDGFVRHPR